MSVSFASNQLIATHVTTSMSALPILISVMRNKSVKIMTEATVVAVEQAMIELLMVLVVTSTSVFQLIMAVR